MSIQQVLQGPQPTTTQQAPREADTLGIDALTQGVQLAGTAIGSGYAKAQAEEGYENAFSAYTKSRAQLDGMKDNLSGLTKRYRTGNRPQALLDQMSSLEKTIRQAEMGEAAGKLSGLSVKARVDSAYKQALNRFPAFAAELRSHRDAAVSGGNLGQAIEQSEINKEIALDESKRLATEMNKYGLSYFNAEDHHVFQNSQRRLGEITRRNEFIKGNLEPHLLKLDFETKSTAFAQADFNLKQDIRDDPLNRKKLELSFNQAKETYEQNVLDNIWKSQDRPIELDQKTANLAKTRSEIARNKDSMQEKISARKVGKAASAYSSEKYALTLQTILEGAGKDLPPEKQLEMLEQSYREDRAETHKLFASSGTLGSSEYTQTMSALDDDRDVIKGLIESGDVRTAQKRLKETKQLEKDLELLNDPNYDRKKMLQNPAIASSLQAYAKLMASAEGVSTATERGNITREALEYAKRTGLDQIIPAQLQKDIAASIASGTIKGNPETTTAAIALAVKDGANLTPEEQNDTSVRMVNKLAQESKYGLEVMADWGGLANARASSENAAQYRTAHAKWFSETVRLLPDGHGIEWKDGKYHITKDDGQSVAVFDHNAVAQPKFGDFGTQRHTGFDKWPFDSSTNLQDLTGQLKDHAWIMENASDLNLTSSLMRDPADKQNMGVVGEALNVANAIGDFFDSAIASNRQALGIDVNTDFITEKYPNSTGFNNSVVKGWNKNGKEYAEIYNEAAAASGVPIDILIRQGAQESIYWKDSVVSGNQDSTAGAKGVSQFMPATARAMGLQVDDEVDERTDPTKSIYAQAELMKQLLGKYGGNMEYALADYNGGPKAVAALKSGKPWKETAGYIKNILGK